MNEQAISKEIVGFVDCPRCGQHKEAHKTDKHLCVDCARAEFVRYTRLRQHGTDWIQHAMDNDIPLWSQQPEETQWEYTVWVAYRDTYPGMRPSQASVARQLGTTVGAVKHIASRWSFPVRMQAWMKYADELTLTQRTEEILDMNKAHVEMAAKLRVKLATAVENIKADELSPSEIVALAKLSTDLERKARIDTLAQEEALAARTSGVDNPSLKKAPTNTADLADVVSILAKAGVLGDVAKVGIKQTTEVVAMSSDGSRASLIVDGG